MCTSFSMLNKVTHRRPPQRKSTVIPWIKSYVDQQVAPGAGLRYLEAPSHEVAHQAASVRSVVGLLD